MKNKTKDIQEQEKTGKEIVPVEGAVQQVQTTNKFSTLEIEEGEVRSQKVSPRVTNNGTPKTTRTLNPKAFVFNPK